MPVTFNKMERPWRTKEKKQGVSWRHADRSEIGKGDGSTCDVLDQERGGWKCSFLHRNGSKRRGEEEPSENELWRRELGNGQLNGQDLIRTTALKQQTNGRKECKHQVVMEIE